MTLVEEQNYASIDQDRRMLALMLAAHPSLESGDLSFLGGQARIEESVQ